MINYQYDGTFPGFLSAVFEVWDRDRFPARIVPPEVAPGLFEETLEVKTADDHADRVWKGIAKAGGKQLCQRFMHVFLSRAPEAEDLMLFILKQLFDSKKNIAGDLSVEAVLKFTQLERKVLREVHRLYMFLRFEQTADGIWFAPVSPKYDVLPMTLNHFKSRFSDQAWLIYDTVRKYGYYYDIKVVEEITIDNPAFEKETGSLPTEAQSEDEQQWQEMWRSYFKHIAIRERANPRLQRQFMPKRFWKHLTEKR
ncbi:putative DNA metabolism protein [Marinilabilia salmonicolor]|jgi:probable DNA metabolism protein|uniref:TIGR03915 family putative DNA repair protein n=1 Tax=Marinilabilia salmonicolor TaxID=989 RepID=UPI000D050728|nr:TIGR03915 family putative DNA repair protein [Marinilabilia salmonicolor]PRY91964.1 putative DNA metabolism protein [Marinilabilia salmonicolor]